MRRRAADMELTERGHSSHERPDRYISQGPQMGRSEWRPGTGRPAVSDPRVIYTMNLKCIVFLAAALPLASTAATDEYVRNADDIVSATNWDEMRTVLVEIREHEYNPEDLVFEKGRPYKLMLRNLGDEKHYFTAPEFYRAIATRKVQADAAGEIKAPYLKALEMMAKGGQLDLYFVPVEAGEYPVYCTIDDHREEGMEGMIVIK